MNDDVRRNPAPLTVVRGAPGLGKSTLAELLRLRLPDGAVIDIDDLRHMICGEAFVAGDDDHYDRAVRVAAQLALELHSTTPGPVIVLDVFASRAFDVFREAAGGVPLFVICLHADDIVLTHRMMSRHCGYVNVGLARALNQQLREAYDSVPLDVGGLSPGDTCEQVIALLGDWRAPVTR